MHMFIRTYLTLGTDWLQGAVGGWSDESHESTPSLRDHHAGGGLVILYNLGTQVRNAITRGLQGGSCSVNVVWTYVHTYIHNSFIKIVNCWLSPHTFSVTSSSECCLKITSCTGVDSAFSMPTEADTPLTPRGRG